MSDGTIDLQLKQDIFQQLKQLQGQFEQLNGKVTNIEKTTTGAFSKMASSIKSISFASVTQSLNNLNQGFQDLNAPGKNFSSSMAEVSAITGVTGKQLDDLGLKARASAKEFGGSAADSLESYKTILSRLGPDIAKDQTALAEMERNVRILSKTMGNDAAGSVDALTTAMLQYGVDLSNPAKAQKEMARMMNVMAAGAKYGAAEVPSISAALKVSGVAAKQANVSFEETNAALQSLAAGGKEGSEAGTALRNVLGKMAGEDVIPKEAAEKLKRLGVNMDIVSNTSLPFATRLKELKKAQGDATAIAQVFGTENAAAANILLDSVDAQEKLTKQVTGTNDANEQAAVIMETTEEKLARMKASIDDAKIAFFEVTGGATAYLEPLTQLATTFSAFSPLVSGASKGIGKMKDMLSQSTGVTGKMSGALSKAGGMLKSFGGALAGIGIGAFITLAVEAVRQFYLMASGADAAERAFNSLKNAREEGEAAGKKYTDVGNTAYDDAIRKAERLRKAGKINDEELAARKLKIAKNQAAYYDFEMNEIKALIKIHEEDKALYEKRGDKDMAFGHEVNIKELKAQQHAMYQGAKDAKNLLLDLEAEKTGKKNGKGTATVSPSGYQPTETNYNGAGGEVKNINVRIENLIKDFTISSTSINESAASLRNKITEAMVGAVRDFEVAM